MILSDPYAVSETLVSARAITKVIAFLFWLCGGENLLKESRPRVGLGILRVFSF